MKKIKKITALFFALVLLATAVFPVYAAGSTEDEVVPEPSAEDDELTVERCQSAYLMNLETGEVIFSYQPNEVVYPASTVKLMTAIVAFEAFDGRLDTEITVTEDMLSEAVGNRIGFSVGEIVTVEEILNCMLVNSANDAAIILAHAVSGDTASFVHRMNNRALELGATSTYYTNPTGMHDPAMVTTAADTALIAAHAYAIPGLVDMTATPSYVMEATNLSDYRNIYNRNGLISRYYFDYYYYDRAIGLNAGATAEGSFAIAAVAENEAQKLTYLAVVLGADGDNDTGDIYSYINCIRMFDWAFLHYGMRSVLSPSRVICELPVNLSSTLDYVTLVPEEEIVVFLPTSVDLATEIRYSYNTFADALDAPIEAGDEAGIVTVLYGDKILGTCALVTTSSITRSEFLNLLAKMQAFTTGRFFRGAVISAVVISVAYVFLKAFLRERKMRRYTGRR